MRHLLFSVLLLLFSVCCLVSFQYLFFNFEVQSCTSFIIYVAMNLTFCYDLVNCIILQTTICICGCCVKFPLIFIYWLCVWLHWQTFFFILITCRFFEVFILDNFIYRYACVSCFMICKRLTKFFPYVYSNDKNLSPTETIHEHLLYFSNQLCCRILLNNI